MKRVIDKLSDFLKRTELKLRNLFLGIHPDNTIFNYNWTWITALKKELYQWRNYVTGTVVDIGAGPVPYLKYFADQVECYYAIDFTYPKSVDTVDNKLIFIKAKAEETTLSNDIADTVISTQFLYAHPDPEKVFQEIGRLLKKNGILILATPCSQPLITEPYDYLRLTPNYFKYIASKYGFEVITIKPLGDIFTSFALGLSLSLVLNPYNIDGSMKLLPYRQWLFSPLIFVVNLTSYIFDKVFRFSRFPANLFFVARKL